MLLADLYELQDRLGWLPEAELRRLAERKSIPLARVHEIVSAYPLFRTAGPPPRVLVRVCQDPVCQLRGGDELRQSLIELACELGESQVEVEPAACLGQCDRCPAISINHYTFAGLDPAEMRRLVRSVAAGERLTRPRSDASPLGWQIDPYRGQPGYEALRRCVAARDPAAIVHELEVADLRGSGGFGSPVAAKWRTVRNAAGSDKVVIANAHGGEPGSVKDRELLRRAPHVVIEGMLLAALATGATRGVIVVRHDYLDELESLHAAIALATRSGLCGDTATAFGRPFPIDLFISPGNFVSGELTALLELLEGRRGEPRVTPPDPTEHGLFGQPTVIHNVETLAWVPSIVHRGGDWFRTQGQRGQTGLRIISIIGDVRHPGAYEIPAGLTFGELLDIAGGVTDGDDLQAIAPAGPLGGFLPAILLPTLLASDELGVRGRAGISSQGSGIRHRSADSCRLTPDSFASAPSPQPSPPEGRGGSVTNLLNLPLDPAVVASFGARLGSTFIVLSRQRDLAEFTRSCLQFFARESCGKCLPCRLGTRQFVETFDAARSGTLSVESQQAVDDLHQAMQFTSLCGLGRWAANPFESWLRNTALPGRDPVG